jgi:hypothetical protein
MQWAPIVPKFVLDQCPASLIHPPGDRHWFIEHTCPDRRWFVVKDDGVQAIVGY